MDSQNFKSGSFNDSQNEGKESFIKLSGIIVVIVLVSFVCFLSYLVYKQLASFNRSRHGTKVVQCSSNLKNISMALEMYKKDHGEYPLKLSQITPDYLRIIPTCAHAKKDTYSTGYKSFPTDPSTKTNNSFTIYCHGHYHGCVDVKENYPQYSSERGLVIYEKMK